jgi:outer membrane protein assembly factor BamB
VRWAVALYVAILVAALVGCGGGSSSDTATTSVPSHADRSPVRQPIAYSGTSWTRFGYDAARFNAAPRGLSAAKVGKLEAKQVHLDGTVDSSPIYLSGIRLSGKRRNLLVMTTTYGRTLGLNPATGATIWSFTPSSYSSLAGSAQITTATPVADPDGRFVYTASPDGLIHKLRLANGHEVRTGKWPASVTRDAAHEKIAPALNLSGRYVLVTTGGYIGDEPPYQGKVAAISRSSGRVAQVLNSLCSNRRRIIEPSSCPSQHSAIWGRGGAVVAPVTHRIYATTGNGPFNGRTDWGDSVLELAPAAKRLRRHFTPTNARVLEETDADLGSASPALLPAPKGGSRARYVLQGGKDGKLRLLSLRSSLYGVRGSAGRRLGGQVQTLPTPGGDQMYTAPAVLHRSGSVRVFVATGSGTSAYELSRGRLHVAWQNSTAGTSPVIAGGLVWVYDPNGGLNVYRVSSGKLVRSLPAPPGHWNSPIVAGGRVFLPSGDANDHSTSGELTIYGELIRAPARTDSA